MLQKIMTAQCCAAPQITNAHKMPFGFGILNFGFRFLPFNTSQPTFHSKLNE